MAKARVAPNQLTDQQVLGNFLEYFDVAGVIITCFWKGEVYHFARWRTAWGKIMALGHCRHLDNLRYAALWSEPPTGGPVALPGKPTNLTGLTDEQVLRQFVNEVECDAAILQYNQEHTDSYIFWRWRNKVGQDWATTSTKSLRGSHQPLWNEVPYAGQALCPATFEEVVRVTGQDSRDTTAARARRYGWSTEHIERINAGQITISPAD